MGGRPPSFSVIFVVISDVSLFNVIFEVVFFLNFGLNVNAAPIFPDQSREFLRPRRAIFVDNDVNDSFYNNIVDDDVLLPIYVCGFSFGGARVNCRLFFLSSSIIDIDLAMTNISRPN